MKIIKLLFLINSVKFIELALKEDKYNFIMHKITNLNKNIELYLFIQNIKDEKIMNVINF